MRQGHPSQLVTLSHKEILSEKHASGQTVSGKCHHNASCTSLTKFLLCHANACKTCHLPDYECAVLCNMLKKGTHVGIRHICTASQASVCSVLPHSESACATRYKMHSECALRRCKAYVVHILLQQVTWPSPHTFSAQSLRVSMMLVVLHPC